MFKTYLKTTFRNLLKRKGLSLINILGLSIGMAAFLIIIQYVRFETSYERFHEKAEDIFRVTVDRYKAGELVIQDAESHPVLGPMLKEKMPEVKDFFRMHDRELSVLKVGEQLFNESRLYFADPSVFSIFSLKTLYGNTSVALHNPWEIVLTKSMAKKYFGKENAVNEVISLVNDKTTPLKVVGVIEDIPPNTHLKFDFLLSFSSLKELGYDPEWNGNNEFTFLLMEPGTAVTAFNEKLASFSKELKEKIGETIFVSERITDIHLYSNKTYEPETNGDARTVYFMLIIAFFTVLIAWVNYLNLSTARAMERAHEVGVKKVVGSSKNQLIFQFLLESAIMNFLALVIAFNLVLSVMPIFRNISGQPIVLNLTGDYIFWLLLGGLFIVGTILSGLYPAFVLSSFRPASILKGKLKNSKSGFLLRKGLVVFQFAVTVILMVGTFTVVRQLGYLRDQDLGMDIDQVLVVEHPLEIRGDSLGPDKMDVLRNRFLENKAVQRMGRSGIVPGFSHKFLNSTTGVRRRGTEETDGVHTYYHFGIDAYFIPSLDMKIIAGRNFEDRDRNRGQVIANEEAIRLMGFTSPEEAIGQYITFGDSTRIIGVIKNYHHQSLKLAVDPMLYWYSRSGFFSSVKVKTENIKETISELKGIFKDTFKNSPFSYFFLDDKFDQQYRADIRFGQVFGLFAGLAIFIACLGLFGLSSFTVLQRAKEISIRKVIGATTSNVLMLLTKDYMKLVIIACVIAIPIANYFVSEWLDNFAFKVNLSWWLFAIPGLLVLMVAAIAVASQSFKAATENPVKRLRSE
ncbi:ABC transporter permease [Fulvivirgaceae bacterium BMA10]|uniref:ABC transporter permease n=1 Tax=Splendidivirga corallicola TaxID=3051826 RepID=A0ABT8KUT2_9BACT|nr:ABC transporter permease [Fulvivirgaceae bacterium BMA10]